MVVLVGCHAGGLGTNLRPVKLLFFQLKKMSVNLVYFGEFRVKFSQKGDFSLEF